jgi:hypothetical protein
MGENAPVRFRGIASALDGQWQTVVWDEKRQRSEPLRRGSGYGVPFAKGW